MDNNIMKQIQILQEMKSKCVEICGYYGDIDTAIAALQICSTFGLDNTARFVSVLNNNGINSYEQLFEIISNSSLSKSKSPIYKDKKLYCPNCLSEITDEVKHCTNCGQHIIYDSIREVNNNHII